MPARGRKRSRGESPENKLYEKVRTGKNVVLLGSPGVGKSTFVKILLEEAGQPIPKELQSGKALTRSSTVLHKAYAVEGNIYHDLPGMDGAIWEKDLEKTMKELRRLKGVILLYVKLDNERLLTDAELTQIDTIVENVNSSEDIPLEVCLNRVVYPYSREKMAGWVNSLNKQLKKEGKRAYVCRVFQIGSSRMIKQGKGTKDSLKKIKSVKHSLVTEYLF